MKYYKLISDKEIEEFTKRYVIIEDTVYANPKPSRLKGLGYKPLLSEEEPSYDPELETVERVYTQTEDNIIESFIVRTKEEKE